MRIKIAIVAALAVASLAACGSVDQSKDALPQAPAASSASEQPVEEPAAPAASTCDVAREAFLTGTVADQTKALKALKADKAADATAREYAGYWLVRDAKNKDLREMDQTLIVSACSL